MPHFAQIDENNKVVQVLVITQEAIDTGAWGDASKWVQASYNTRAGVHYDSEGKPDGEPALRKNYPSVGFTYDPARDAFIPPKVFDNWVLNENTCTWEPNVGVQTDKELMVYNFLAEKHGWAKLSNVAALSISFAKQQFVRKSSYMIKVSDQSILSTLYTWGMSELGYVKEENGVITEYYTLPPEDSNITASWISLDLNTNQILEYYTYDYSSKPIKELKHSPDGTIIQENFIIDNFNELPAEYKSLLENFSDKDNIFLYSEKPYGKVVEVRYK